MLTKVSLQNFPVSRVNSAIDCGVSCCRNYITFIAFTRIGQIGIDSKPSRYE